MVTDVYNFGELHQVQLKLFKELVSICKTHGLTWFLGFGSLLGAVRECRILPWDNSIDVVLPYGDYQQLLSLDRETWADGLFLQTFQSDLEYRRCYAKLRDSNTTLVVAEYADMDINQGIYINIMPIIRLADEGRGRGGQLRDARSLKMTTEGLPLPSMSIGERIDQALVRRAGERGRRRRMDALWESVVQYEEAETECCFVFAGAKSLELALQRSWFASAVEWDFEGGKANVPCGWNEWLTLRYGDYMTAPIAEIQADKSSSFITLDTRNPYIHYRGRSYCVNRGE